MDSSSRAWCNVFTKVRCSAAMCHSGSAGFTRGSGTDQFPTRSLAEESVGQCGAHSRCSSMWDVEEATMIDMSCGIYCTHIPFLAFETSIM